MTFSEAIEKVLELVGPDPLQAEESHEACDVIFQFMESWGDAIKDMELLGEEDK